MKADDDFLDAILAAPADDAPRLVYADALTERGDPLGELIIVQCERARLDREGRTWTRRYDALVKRDQALMLPQDDAWKQRTRGIEYWFYRYDRGFLGYLRVSPEQLRRFWPAFSRTPLETIQLRHQITLADIAWTLEQAPRLATVMLEHSVHRDATLDAAILRTLGLGSNEEAWPMDGLIHPSLRPAITRLNLDGPSAADVAMAGTLPNLTHVDFQSTPALEPDDMRPFREMRALRHLQLGYLLSETAAAMVEGPPPPNLRELVLMDEFAESFRSAFAKSAWLPQLERLAAELTLDDRLAVELGTRAVSLKHLELGSAPDSDQSIDLFVASDVAKRLETLILTGRYSAFPKAILEQTFERLRTLKLQVFSIDVDQARAMVAGLPTVENLSVSGSLADGVTDILRARWPEMR